MDVSGFDDSELNAKAKQYIDCYDPEYTPNSGDTVFFRFSESGYHVGIVLFADPNSDYIYTVEGNTSGDGSSSEVSIKCRSKNDVFGYGRNS